MDKIASFLIISLSIGLLLHLEAKRIPNFAGPYRILFRRISNRTEEFKSTGKVWVQLNSFPQRPRLNQPQYYWGQSFNSIDVNDDIKMDVRVYSWANNQWKKNAFFMKFEHACSDMMLHAKPIMAVFFGDEGTKCPIKQGYRPIKNQSKDIYFPQFPVFPYGRLLATALMIKNEETIGLIVAELEDVPRL